MPTDRVKSKLTNREATKFFEMVFAVLSPLCMKGQNKRALEDRLCIGVEFSLSCDPAEGKGDA